MAIRRLFHPNAQVRSVRMGKRFGLLNISLIKPDHDVFRGNKITLVGSDFGAYQKDKGSVVYFDNKPDTIFSADTWKDKEIASIIPFPANTGDVYVENATGARSNGKTLTLPELKDITVTIRDKCEGNFNKSPNPFFDEQ